MAWHARLAASNASRWMNCTGSPGLIASLPEGGNRQSKFAALGTAAHHLGAYCLLNNKESAFDGLGECIHIVGGDAYFSWDLDMPPLEAEYKFVVDNDMADAVDVYLNLVARLREEVPGDEERIEQRLDMSWLNEAFGGTADYIKPEPFGTLYVVDYKHGSGVLVEVTDNYQLRKYAVGALHLYPDCDSVCVYIVQPRAPHGEGPVRFVEFGRDELAAFSDRMVKAAEDIEEGGELVAGSWCKWCPAAAAFTTIDKREVVLCPALRSEIERQTLADFDEEPPEILPPPATFEELGRARRWVKVLDGWCREVEALSAEALQNGHTVPGAKLVWKRTYRAWTVSDEKKLGSKILRLAKKLGYGFTLRDLYSKPKFLSPNQADGLGKGMKKALKEAGLWEKPAPSELTVADEDDSRAAVNPQALAAADFEDDEV